MTTTERLISHTVRHHRRQKGWTQAALAEAAGVSLSTINRVENQQMPVTAENQKAISKALGWPEDGFEKAASGHIAAPETDSRPVPEVLAEINSALGEINDAVDEIRRDIRGIKNVISLKAEGNPRQ